MNEHDQQLKIRENVLGRVKRGVPMRSRAYFVARVAASAIVSVAVLAISAYVLSFIAFSVHESGEQFLLGFGGRGIQTFLVLFPWLPAIVDIALIIFLEWLLQGFKFGYRLPLIALFAVVLIASAAIAAAIYITPFNGQLLDMADRGQLPVIGHAYEEIRDSHQGAGVFRGTVTAIDSDQITIGHNDGDHDADDGSWNVVLPPGYSTSTLSIGERVYVLGTPSGPVVHADGMEELSPDQ
jgi:TM2 domain-containing membrane protein YozV